MKKLKFFLSLLMLFTFSLGNVWAVETPLLTADFTAKTAGSNSYKSTWTYGDFTMVNAANNSKAWAYMKFGGKSADIGTYNPCYVVSPQVTKAVKSIDIVTNVNNLTVGSVNEWGVYVYSDAECTDEIDHVTGGSMTASTAETLTLEPTAPATSWPANSYYKVYFDLANTTSTNGIVWLDKINWYEYSTDPTFSASVSVLDFGTVEQNSGVSSTISKTFTLTGANITKQVAVLCNGAIYYASPDRVNPDGDGNISQEITVTASTAYTGTKNSYIIISSTDSEFDDIEDLVTMTMEVVTPVLPEYVEINRDKEDIDLEEGKTLQLSVANITPTATNKNVIWTSSAPLVASVDATGLVTALQPGETTIYCKCEADEEVYTYCTITVTEHVVTPGTYDIVPNTTFWGCSGINKNNATAHEINFTGSQDDITIEIDNGTVSSAYINASQTRVYNGYTMEFSAPSGYVLTAITFTADGSNWAGTHTADAGSMTDNKNWEGGVSSVTITFGGTCRIAGISVTYAAAPSVIVPTISGQTPFYKTTTVTIECETDGAEIHYTTDGSEPTGGDNTYHDPFQISATTTVKAIAIKGVDVSEVVSKTFTITDAISVADAIDLIPENNNTVDNAFVIGYVCTAGTSVSSGQMTYYISDDGTTDDTGTATTDRLQIYKGKNLNNTDFSAASDLVVGDKVVVYGQLKNYNGTYEFNSGNYIVEKVAKGDVASVAISGTATHGAYEGGDAFDPEGLTVTATYASGFQEDVTASATWSPATITTQSGNTDVTASFGGKTSAAKTVNISLNKYTVTFNTSVYGGTWGIQKAGEPISSGNHFPKGTVLTVVTNPVAGYTLGSITVNDEPLVGNEITIGTENITVAVEFTMVQEGVLVLSTKSLDWGTITVGTSPLSVPSKTFTLTGSNLTEGRTVTLTTPDWCHLTQTTANPTAGGNIATTSFYVFVNDATLNAAGEYSGNIVISSDDLTADSLIAVSLNVVEATPSISVKDVYAQDITSIDFDNVDKGASVSQFNISLVGHNLTGDVKVTVANATSTNVFVTNGFRPSNTYSPSGGEIDAAVYVIPYTSTGGEFNGTITFHSESGDFDDIVIPLHINIKPDAGLAWSASSATAYTKAKPYTLPTLTNPHDVTVAYSGNNDEVATVNASTGEVTLVAAGEVTITASFAGNGDYVAQEVEYTLTVKAPTGLRLSGEMTTKEYEEGDHVSVEGYTVEAVFGSPSDYYDVTSEATWTLDGYDIATRTVTGSGTYGIEAAWQGFTASESVSLTRKTHAVTFNNPEHGNLTVKVGDDTFLSGAKWKKGTVVTITISPDAGYEGAVTINGEPLVGNSYTIGTEDITIVATFNKVPVAAGLEWSTSTAYVRKGSALNEFPTLSNPNGIEGITYESTDESIATIHASTGAISLLANGETTLKAIFAGNDDYLAQTVECTLHVAAGIVTITPAAPVALELGNVPFGSTRADYGQSFHLNITNLISGQYNQVKIDFTGSAFWTAGNNYITDNDQDGVIDVDVTIVPSEYWWSLSEANALGEQNTTITLMCTGSAQFEDVVVGTATMKVVESTPTAIDNVEAEQQARKVIINDKMYIIRGEKMYDAQGKLVK